MLAAQTPSRVHLRFDTAEAVVALAVIRHAAPDSAVFATTAYRRLKDREAAFHRAFTDSEFAAFLASDTLAARADTLRRTLAAWEAADLDSAAARALAYLPPEAHISATVYVVIKPHPNSFVWDTERDPAIFLYLDPAKAPADFENTVAHELHHIGYSSAGARTDSLVAALPDSVKPVALWISAFGEGFAMLAAAGGPDVNPHATSKPEDRRRWDFDMTHVNDALRQVDGFFHDILARRLPTPDAISAVGMSYFGIQGPWYTVGYLIATTIEKRFGREELIACMYDPHRLLQQYNEAATEINRSHPDSLALFGADVLQALAPRR